MENETIALTALLNTTSVACDCYVMFARQTLMVAHGGCR
jgi:hypothetical protein